MRSEQEDLLALGDMGTTLARVRSHFESMVQSGGLTTTEKQSLEGYYGGNWFKCPRHLCFYFHEGFPTAKNRDQHLNRHDLPFCCSHEGCSRAQTGFSTEKELKAHIKKSHPDLQSLSWRFPKADKTPLQDGRIQKHPATWQCTLCPRRFTRAYALRSHLRTHTDERPFVCTVCGKAFVRQNDRKRHEDLHGGEKKFTCKGKLKQGGQWGCGRRFVRPDALDRHFRSEAGRICIKPLLDEEAIARQIAWMQSRGERNENIPANSNEMATVDSSNYTLPAALLAQYPALATLKWDMHEGDTHQEDDS